MSVNWTGDDGRYDTRTILPHEDSPWWLVALVVVALVVCVLVVPAWDQSQLPYANPAIESSR
jgi:hypothetical protein